MRMEGGAREEGGTRIGRVLIARTLAGGVTTGGSSTAGGGFLRSTGGLMISGRVMINGGALAMSAGWGYGRLTNPRILSAGGKTLVSSITTPYSSSTTPPARPPAYNPTDLAHIIYTPLL